MRAIGLMSGTSLDGIDAALVEIREIDSDVRIELVRFATIPFANDVHARLLSALPPNEPTIATVMTLDRDLGDALAAAAFEVAHGERVDSIASHGLTIHHRGEAGISWQIGDPYRIRERMGTAVVHDFRRADCAAGGNGAPLAPYVDALLFRDAPGDRVALNLGGIANVSVIRHGAPPSAMLGWDTGPGNMLIDEFVRRRTDGRERFDRDGAYAARGRVDRHALRELIGREAFFLMQPPPKSTGRERFGGQLLDAQADVISPLTLTNGAATLTAYTAATIADSLGIYGPRGATIVVSGGGAHNPTLLAMLAERVEPLAMTVVPSSAYGIDPDAKEALAFAVLGYETLRGRTSNVPAATGASHAVLLGSIAPFESMR